MYDVLFRCQPGKRAAPIILRRRLVCDLNSPISDGQITITGC
jgi:hypothetical protein